jgi:hypothetical protein
VRIIHCEPGAIGLDDIVMAQSAIDTAYDHAKKKIEEGALD